MKKSTMRSAIISACVVAGLVLSGCGGSDDTASQETAEQGGTAEGSGAEEASGDAAFTEEEIVAAIEAAGLTAEVTDVGSTDELAGAMGDTTVEPKECEVFMNAALAAAEDQPMTVVTGLPDADSQLGAIAVAIGYPSADDASAALESNSASLGACSEMTVSAQGMDVTSNTAQIDASIDGAEDVFATEVSMDISGQKVTTTNVQGRKGSAIVGATGSSSAAAEGASVDEMSSLVSQILAELP